MRPEPATALSPVKAALLERLRAGRAGAGEAPLLAPEPGTGIPLTWGQEQVWLACQVTPDEPLYNEAVTVQRTGSCDVDALQAAFNLILSRNDSWRTTFEAVAGIPRQVVRPHVDLTFPFVDLSDLPEVDREPRAVAIATADARVLFDLERGPLVRGRLVRCSDTDHRLYLVLHHIIFDGVALRLFLDEFVRAYADLAAGRTPSLADPAAPYAHYACWERRSVTPEVLESRLAYWREQLGGVAPVDLPADHPAPAQRTASGAMERLFIDRATADGLNRVARERDSTLFQVFLAAYFVLLHRYTGQDDIVLAGMADGRRHRALEKVHGFFANPIPIRVDLSGNPTFAAVVGQVRDTLLAGLQYEVPFGHLLGALQPDRGTTRNPILQVALSLVPPMPPLADGWDMREFDIDVVAAKFDLHLLQEERADGSVGRFAYSTDLFDRETARDLAEHWNRLLCSIAADPETPISELPMLGDAQREMLLDTWSRSDAPFPRDRCIHELIEEQVRLRPDAVAVTFGGGSLTYASLDATAARIAARLTALGVGPEKRVGICVERGLPMVAGVLGILKSGGAYVPLDPSYPPDRVEFMMQDGGIEVLLTQRHLPAASCAGTATVLFVDEIGDADSDAEAPTPTATRAATPAAVTARNLAYVIYTSGSTGQPKGVCIEHRAVVNHITALIRDYELVPGDTVLQLPSLSFHPAVRDILGTLSAGARLVLLSEDSSRDPLAIVDTMAAERVTAVLSLLPSLLRTLLEDDRAQRVPVHLRLMLTCGEALPLEDARAATSRFGCIVANQFGPTESVMACAKHTVGPADVGIMVPAGRPEANARLYVVDRYGGVAPVGARGELCVGGASIARGYLDRPDLTAERFVADPFAPLNGARMCRTGDIVRYRRDGVLEFLGRRDDQIKIRGYRVELNEIEATLATCPGVRAAAATASHDAGAQRRLLAAVVVEPGTEPLDVAGLRARLRERLPSYMIPSVIVPIDQLPLTQSGKVDRAALADHLRDREEPTDVNDPPATDTERALAAIWAKALRRSDLGRGQSFFDLGGNSLMAAQTLVAVEERLGRRLPLAAFFRTDPTIAALAALLDDATVSPPPTSSGPQQLIMELRAGTTPGLICVHADEGALIAARRWLPWLEPSRAVYGLLPPRIGRRFDRSSSVEELSEAMLEPLLSVQPRGPFYLEGYSFGGLLAYELAGLLRAQGHDVAFLALVDTPVPAEWLRQTTLWAKARWELRRGPLSATKKVTAMARRHSRSALSRIGFDPGEPGWFDSDGSKALFSRYHARPHDVPLVVFTATESLERFGSAALGWEKVHDGDVETVILSGDHFTIVSGPSVEKLARALSDRMSAASTTRSAEAGTGLP
jgi:amino acid adenylation domain-containing protein